MDHERQVLVYEPGIWAPLATQREVLGDHQARPNGYLVANVDEQGIEHEWSPPQCNLMRLRRRDARSGIATHRGNLLGRGAGETELNAT